ncbi:MAG: hypothetical protein A3H79_03560 [Candidatus Levybacteria bacterium RIFCSPLOWO2_02_FULL_36_8b]|nr:MAG: hypothetical protein A3H79_03560 [Candidatus Levybacteria bacterium RIFCSPLOWO2_02_FULL_36_8b]
MKHRHKKTRKQKVIADYRHHTYTAVASSANLIPNPYSYAYKDLLKTGMLTLSMISAELIIFLLLKNHIVTLPSVSY